MSETKIVLAMVLYMLFAAALEWSVNRRPGYRRRFAWTRYAGFVAFPLFGSAVLVGLMGFRYIYVFMLSAAVGAAAEWLLGVYYRRIMGSALWTYKTYAIGSYTSWLILPAWGFAGLLFVLLARLIEGL